jgi:anaerobic selenocysteine-containing dehydrogenase
VFIRPDDAAANGIADGARVALGNHRGSVELTAEIFPGLPPGCLIAEGVHPNQAHAGGKGINTLIGSDQVPPFGGVAFHDATVWIRPVNGSSDAPRLTADRRSRWVGRSTH